MEQFDQLLTCAICLDRYRNPKLLPCQHSFCMEPCMEGLVDYVRRQVKCPECRAEHRIPYQGVQAFPTNVTLQRFLELHIEITGELPDPTTGQTMERCNVCSDKNYCSLCAHCDKKVCPECREAHMDVLKREIARINNQIRRTLHRLQDVLSVIEKNTLNLQQNCTSVTEEIDEIFRRLAKALKDRMECLKGEIDRYMSTEVHNLVTLKDNLEQEIANIQSNCELAESHMTENSNYDWDDCELMDTKDIFLRTVEFIRNFDYEAGDYSRRVRFSVTQDPNQLHMTLASYGDLSINIPGQIGNNLTVPTAIGPGLMRSKSDHRLASQYRPPEDRTYSYGNDGEGSGRTSPTTNRRFGERRDNRYTGHDTTASTRYGRSGEYGGGEYDSPSYDAENRRPRFRSRFTRHLQDNADSDNEPSGRSVRFNEQEPGQRKERERVIDTEDVARGPLSGITRLFDSPRVMKRLQETETKDKKKDKEPERPTQKSAVTAPAQQGKAPGSWRAAQRQMSEEDEIARQKKQNKEPAASESAKTGETPPRQRKPSTSSAQQEERGAEDSAPARPRHSVSGKTEAVVPESDDSGVTPSRRRSTAGTNASSTTTSTTTPKASEDQRPSTQGKATTTTTSYSRTSSGSSENLDEIEPGTAPKGTPSSRLPLDRFKPRSNSSDSSASTESSASSTHSTGAAFSTDEVKQKYLSNIKEQPSTTPAATAATAPPSSKDSSGNSTPSRYSSASSTARGTALDTTPTPRPRFQSRFLGRAATPTAEASKESESSSSETEEETTSASESEEEEEETPAASAAAKDRAKNERELSKTDIGPLLARSANARDSTASKKDDLPPSSSYSARPRGSISSVASSGYSRNEPSSTYGGERETSYASRYGLRDRDSDRAPERDTYGSRDRDYTSGLTRSRTGGSLTYGRDDPTPSTDTGSRYSKYLSRNRTEDETPPSSRYGGYTSRFLNRSKSSAAIAPDKDEDEEEERPSLASRRLSGDDTTYPSGRSRYTALKDRRSRVARSRSSHDLGLPDEEEPEASPTSSYLSRYGAGKTSSQLLKSRENSPERTDKDGASGSSSLSSWARYLKNKYGSRNKDSTSPSSTGVSTGAASGAASASSGQQVPRSRSSLAVGLPSRTASIESSDDDQKNSPTSPTSPTAAGFGDLPRNQYLQKRRLLFKIGSRGSEPGCFTWPRGIAVGPDSTIVVADSSNHRVQVFDQTGIFHKEFGSYGNAEGEFDCLAGVAVNRIGQYIIADRYNHRIQVFDPSGRFLRAFGSQGTADGRFNYPWGITTDALGFVYVCDKENHRVQVFQSDGTFVGKFGSMGSKSGQLEHPHYIAVSSTNRVIVSDSNNHRIQIFDVNGKVLTSFGSEGSEEGQFKFPRGVAVDDQGYIFVGDSGNNRIQIFHPDGIFLRAFGCWGSGDGEFKGLEGLAVTPNGSILVCDRENHRIQVF